MFFLLVNSAGTGSRNIPTLYTVKDSVLKCGKYFKDINVFSFGLKIHCLVTNDFIQVRIDLVID